MPGGICSQYDHGQSTRVVVLQVRKQIIEVLALDDQRLPNEALELDICAAKSLFLPVQSQGGVVGCIQSIEGHNNLSSITEHTVNTCNASQASEH